MYKKIVSKLLIHAPSLAIGAAIASISLIVTFLGFGATLDEQELVMEPIPNIANAPAEITLDVIIGNGSPVLGDSAAPITLVEFGDYQCSACNRFFHDTKDQIVENYINTGKVKMIFKDFNIIGQDSVTASHGAHCATDQGLFWEYHDILYSNWDGENTGWASFENLLGFAQDIGLDTDVWSKCVSEQRHSQLIISSNTDARSLELGGTPGFFIIDSKNKVTKIPGALPFANFAGIFDAS